MLKIIIKMCKYLESFNPVWRTDLVSVGLATPRYLHLMWYIREACARTEILNILMPEDAPRAGTITSCNVSLNLFVNGTFEMSLWCAQTFFLVMVSSLNLFSSSVPTRERVFGERNLGVRSELPLLARRKLVWKCLFQLSLSTEIIIWGGL